MVRIRYLINLMIAFLLLLTVAINRDGQLFGTSVQEWVNPKLLTTDSIPAEWITADGVRVVHSLKIANGIIGFAGATPVNVYLRDGVVERVELLESREDAEFINSVVDAGLLSAWNNLTVKEALVLHVDAVSGATYTSTALIKTVGKTLAYTAHVEPNTTHNSISLKSFVGLLIIVLAVLISISAKSKRWRLVQLCLNVVVLGFWSGSFLSLSLFVNWFSSGMNWMVSIVPFALLVAAVVMPLVGKKGHYCHWLCPMGSAQELLGRAVKPKLKISLSLLNYLNYLREVILFVLLFSMWIGVGFDLMGYELFTAFMFRQASGVVLVMSLLFLLLSCFVSRPYCRFVCPTGSLLKYYQQTNIK